jgi:hypothetical protein
MNDINETSSESSNGSDNGEAKQHFICDDKFQLLKQYQQLIFEATEVSPSIRKIVNEIITVENLNKVKDKYLRHYNE